MEIRTPRREGLGGVSELHMSGAKNLLGDIRQPAQAGVQEDDGRGSKLIQQGGKMCRCNTVMATKWADG